MKKKKLNFNCSVFKITIALTTLVLSNRVTAQFDDNEFPPPAPPGSATGGGGSSGAGSGGFGGANNFGSAGVDKFGGSNTSSSDSANKTNEVLSKSKKDKIAQASIDEIDNKNFPELIDSFDYNNAELTDVIKAIGELTGKNFIYDGSVRGKITIIAPTKITVAEAYKAFLSALAFNGFTVVPGEGFYKIKSSRAAQRDNIETYTGSYYPNTDQMITRIVHLKHISAEQTHRDLSRFLATKDGDVQPFNSTNSLIISDYGTNIERIMKILNQLDVPGFEEKLFVLRIKNAKAKDMAELINKIVNKDTSSRSNPGGGGFSAGVPRFGGNTGRSTQGQSGSSYFMVIPDDRTNSLIVVGNNQGIERVKKLVGQLDFRIKADENGGVYVYYVKNGEAEKISQTLSGIAKDSKTPTTGSSSSGFSGGGAFAAPPPLPPQSIFGGDVKITADKETNSLIVTASRQDYEVVLGLLRKIDIPRDQVFIEAVILEMIVKDEFNWGLGYLKFNKETGGVGRAGFNGLNDLSSVLNPVAGTGAILSFGDPKDTFQMRNPVTGETTTVSTLVGFLNVLKANNQTNILSTPQLMALDNEESFIEVGREVAVGMSQQNSVQGTQQTMPLMKDATTKLKIKPFISPASNDVRLKIEQTINEPEGSGTLPGTVSISKRNITTNIVVPNGDTAVLGGLMKDNEIVQVMKVPILGDIPILGWLFKSRSVKKDKSNLLVFLTPKIIRTTKDSHKILDEKLENRLNFIKQNGGRDPYGKLIDDLPRTSKVSQPGKPKESENVVFPEGNEVEPPESDLLEEPQGEPKSDLTPEQQDGRVVE